jgi:deazaflavin-dependent oxidoreductase (nitroreductase family)
VRVGGTDDTRSAEAWAAFADEQYCYLETTGRVSRRTHRVELWFAIRGPTLYMLSGGRDRSDWVKNLLREPAVTAEIGGRRFAGRARIVEGAGEDGRARVLVHDKYAPGYAGDLADWRQMALPIAVDLDT